MRKIASSAGSTGATPTAQIGRPSSMSSCVSGGREQLVVRLEDHAVGLAVDGLLDEEERSADVDVLPLRAVATLGLWTASSFDRRRP
jgi:hypothetical protein